MKIEFERSGGFAGIHTTVTIDSQELAEADSQQLQELIEAATFFALPRLLNNPSLIISDQFHYKVTIQDEERDHTVETTDGGAPDTLRPLLRHLTRLSHHR